VFDVLARSASVNFDGATAIAAREDVDQRRVLRALATGSDLVSDRGSAGSWAQPSDASTKYYIKMIHLKIGTKRIFRTGPHAWREDLLRSKHRQVDSGVHPARSRQAGGNLRARVDQRCNAWLKKFCTSYKLFTVPRQPGEKLGMSGRRAKVAKKRLAENVRRIRLAREMKQTELAMRSRVTQALISAIELQEANPTIESLYRIAQALEVDLTELFAATEA